MEVFGDCSSAPMKVDLKDHDLTFTSISYTTQLIKNL